MKIKRILYIPFDQLNVNYGILKNSDPQSDLIVMVESERMVSNRDWHPTRLFFLISSARKFLHELKNLGYDVRYIKAVSTASGINIVKNEFPGIEVFATEPSSFRLHKILSDLGVNLTPNDFFLTSRVFFNDWAVGQKKFVMENFYRYQRIRFNLLVENGKPVGGQWNFDKENRLPPPKEYNWPKYPEFSYTEIDESVAEELEIEIPSIWATDRSNALIALEHFIKFNLANFGPFEDAMSLDSWSMHHSLLSPYLNNGLLHPVEVVKEAIEAYQRG